MVTATPEAAVLPALAAIPDCVQLAIQDFFGTLCGEAPVLQEACPSASPSQTLIGIIPFSGDLGWSFALGFPRETAIAVSEKFAGFAIDFDSADMGDIVGELANVVAGDLVARLDERGIDAAMSVPRVARCHEAEAMPPEGQDLQFLNYRSAEGAFWARISIPNSGDPALGARHQCPVCGR